MKSRRLNVSEDSLTTSMNGRENSLLIPMDLLVEIFSWLPAKTIARFRCLAKPWASILQLPYFMELFQTKSYARRQL
ncbi:F-box protein DOR [Cardamine amara subsp. amara]